MPGSSRPTPIDIFEQLMAMDWPDAFIVQYRDGTSERLLKNKGIHISPPGDDPEGHGCFSADLPKKHPRNQKQCGRHVPFSDLLAILDEDGNLLWPQA